MMETFTITLVLIVLFYQAKELRPFHLFAVFLSLFSGDIEVQLAFLASFYILNDKFRDIIDVVLTSVFTNLCNVIGNILVKTLSMALKISLKVMFYASNTVIKNTVKVTAGALNFIYRQIAA